MPWDLEQIDAMRSTLEEARFRKEAVDVDDVLAPYFVIPHEWAAEQTPGLPSLFAMRMTPDVTVMRNATVSIAQMTVFGVSDRVPHLWRPYWVKHEVREYVAYPLEKPTNVVQTTDTVADGCRLCSVTEWEEVLEAFAPEACIRYAKLRAEFFGELWPWAQASQKYSPEAIAHFRASSNFWAQLTL